MKLNHPIFVFPEKPLHMTHDWPRWGFGFVFDADADVLPAHSVGGDAAQHSTVVRKSEHAVETESGIRDIFIGNRAAWCGDAMLF